MRLATDQRRSVSSRLAEVEDAIALIDRRPFGRLLAKLLVAQPTLKQIRHWANQSPDRWAQAMAIVGRLAGYSERVETLNTSVNIMMELRALSDSDLREKLRQAIASLAGAGAETVEHPEELLPPRRRRMRGLGSFPSEPAPEPANQPLAAVTSDDANITADHPKPVSET